MTLAQRVLLTAAMDARTYFDRRAHGLPSRGMYEVITIGRDLTAAIEAVQQEEAAGIDAQNLEQLVDRR